MSPPFFCEFSVSQREDISFSQASAIGQTSNGENSRLDDSEIRCKFPSFIRGNPSNYTLRNLLFNSLHGPRLFWLSMDISYPKDERRWVLFIFLN